MSRSASSVSSLVSIGRTQTSSTDSLSLVVNELSRFEPVSAWTIDTGTNVLALAENTVGLRDYAVSFNVTNRAKPQQGQLISISSSNEIKSRCE